MPEENRGPRQHKTSQHGALAAQGIGVSLHVCRGGTGIPELSRNWGPQDTKEMWGSLFLKGSECSPCTKGSLAPCPAPQGIGGPPLYRSHVETPGPPPCPIWELQCPHKGKVGSLSACPVLFGNGVRGVPLPVLYGT